MAWSRGGSWQGQSNGSGEAAPEKGDEGVRRGEKIGRFHAIYIYGYIDGGGGCRRGEDDWSREGRGKAIKRIPRSSIYVSIHLYVSISISIKIGLAVTVLSMLYMYEYKLSCLLNT